jgi:hypothetical protein
MTPISAFPSSQMAIAETQLIGKYRSRNEAYVTPIVYPQWSMMSAREDIELIATNLVFIHLFRW